MSEIDIMLKEISQECLQSQKEIEAVRMYIRIGTSAEHRLMRAIDHLEHTLLVLRRMPLFIIGKQSADTGLNTFILAGTGAEITKTEYGYEIRLPQLLGKRRKSKLNAGSYIHDTVLRAIQVYTDKYGYPSQRLKRVVIDVQQVYSSDIRPSDLLDNDNIELRQTINLIKSTFLLGDDPINTKLLISATSGTHNSTIIRLIDLDKSDQINIFGLCNTSIDEM